MAQASLAPCQQADIFHNRKRRRAPLSISTSSPMPPGREADGHKAWVIPCITFRTCSCSCESSGRRSLADPDKQQLIRRLKAGENVLKQVRREKNDLQDANIRLGVELKDVRAQLADSVKENKRLRRGIFSTCLNELL